ncbi:LuxR family transcriptional regulator [Nioella ostreopsis]|uniref:LuxR family transcriptional regulator n=1 Tax=Nioella ostreopsis TaxID=2448479 RepID=UPI000FD6BF65|nr:LuxR family transcriptional regulator [Nioella ostreopsis]
MKRLQPYLKARSVEELWEYHTEQMGAYGFDRLIYAYTCFQSAKSLSNPEDALILTNYPSDYIEAYIGHGLYRAAPMMKWASRNVGSISWRHMWDDFDDSSNGPERRELMALNKRFGITAGYTMSFPMAIKRSAAGIGLVARSGLSQQDVDELWRDKGEELEIINQVAHLAITQLPATGQSRVLTPRQSEVLELVADGKSVRDIALLLGRKAATVDKHLRGARESLGVETTAQAVRKASVLNQIFIVDPSAQTS